VRRNVRSILNRGLQRDSAQPRTSHTLNTVIKWVSLILKKSAIKRIQTDVLETTARKAWHCGPKHIVWNSAD